MYEYDVIVPAKGHNVPVKSMYSSLAYLPAMSIDSIRAKMHMRAEVIYDPIFMDLGHSLEWSPVDTMEISILVLTNCLVVS